MDRNTIAWIFGLVTLAALSAGCTAGRSSSVRTVPEPVGAADPVAVTPTVEPERPVLVAEFPEFEIPPIGEDDGDEVRLDESLTASPLDQLAEIELDLAAGEHDRQRVVEDVPLFDIPMEITEPVLVWVDVYTGRLRPSFIAGLKRSGRYIDRFREIFEEVGVPQDLVYMAAVESGYKTSAYSRAHARGIFQFIAPTARRYGLRVDYWVDDRADPEKSARAAATYMKDLYAEFGDWYLALAAYNAGEGKIRRALARSGQDDFWGIAVTRHIHRETKNHVPAILAATLISKQPAKYGMEVERNPPLLYDTITLDGAADLRVIADCAGVEPQRLRELNPALRRLQTPPGARTDVHVPPGRGAATLAALAEVPLEERILYVRHRVRSGETLSALARRYDVSVRAIQDSNGMGRSTMIRVNRELKIPTTVSGRYADVALDLPATGGHGDVLTYRVRRGDTLSGISRRYGTTPAAIAAATGISVNKTLQIGERVTVVRGVRSPSDAARRGRGTTTVAASGARDRTHTVRRGDTLWRIASEYRTSVDRLCTLNRISPSTVIHPGTRLTVSSE